MSGYGNYMLESNMEWYAEQAEKLVKHINKINAASQKEVENNPGLWIPKITNDPKHWAEYGVHTPGELEAYLDREAEREMRKEAMY